MKFDPRSWVTLVLYVALNLTLAVVWHLVLLREVLAEAAPFARSEPVFALGLAAMVVHGVLLLSIYPLFHRPASPIRSGVRFGGGVGLFLAAGAIWVDVGKFEFTHGVSYLVWETLYEVLSFTALGILLAARYRRVCSTPSVNARAQPA